ncbi:hypothetical protein KA012_00670 [Candidatus Woesebacteria bacterium]|nr:hypothetical protein [Candidatus Woesebacteria bacterium]
MPNRIFRRSHSITHATARSSRTRKGLSLKWVRILSITCALGLITAAAIVLKPQHVVPVITGLECTDVAGANCPDSVLQHLSPLLGQPLLFTDLLGESKQLLAATGFTVSQYQRVLPGTVRLAIEPLETLFYLDYEGSNTTTAVTAGGATIGAPETLRLEVLQITSIDSVTNQTIQSNSHVPAWLLQAVAELAVFFDTSQLRPEKILLRTPFELELELAGEGRPILINPQEITTNLERLTMVKSDQYTDIASPSGALDVRFRLPVLRI